MIIEICIVSGVEGLAVYVCDKRLAGPKPWGGGKTIHSFMVELEDLKDAIAEYEAGAQEQSAVTETTKV